MAGQMSYLVDYRADRRRDVREFLPSARSVLCVGKLYNSPWPYSNNYDCSEKAWISRYAWGDDYHQILREGLAEVVRHMGGGFEYKICVDTAPVLERSLAGMAGLGWIGKNTCLINQGQGSWFFLGELLLSIDLEPDRAAPPRCGSCTACIQACPTGAIVPLGEWWTVDARRCISYQTIELRGPIPEESRASTGSHAFGCDICQDVCPWNRCAPVTADSRFHPRQFSPPLEKLAGLSEAEFRAMYRDSPVTRARYLGFLRNVAVAMGNSRLMKFRPALERLAEHADPVVSEHARWALSLDTL